MGRRDRSDLTGFRPHLFAVLLFFYVLVTGLVHGARLMPFEGWDEDHHLGVATYFQEQGTMPTPTDTMPASLWPFLQRHPHPAITARGFAGLHLRNYQGQVYDGARDTWQPPPEATPAVTNPPPLYQAQHGPLFYGLMAGLTSVFGLDAFEARADAGRVLGAFCGGFMAVCWFFILRRMLAGTSFAWMAAPTVLVLAMNSLFVFNHARFANDALANLMAALALLAWATLRTRNPAEISLARDLGGAGLVGLLAGLAVLAKATAMVLIPLFGVGLALRYVPWKQPGLLLGAAALMAAGYLAVAGPYHSASLDRYGTITGMQEAVKNREAGKGLGELVGSATSIPLDEVGAKLLTRSFHVGGYSVHPLPSGWRTAWKVFLGLNGLLLLVCLFLPSARRRIGVFFRQAWELPALLLLTWAGLFYHMVQSNLAYGLVTTNPWYAVIAFPALFCLLLLPATALFNRWSEGRPAGVVTAVLIGAFFLTAYRLGMRGLESLMTDQGRVSVADHHTLLGFGTGTQWVLEGCAALLIAALLWSAWTDLRKPARTGRD